MCYLYFMIAWFISEKHFNLQGRDPYDQGNKKINVVLVENVSDAFTLVIKHKVIK